MARQVHLVRHGEVANPDHVVYAALPGYGLSPLGNRQAREAARYLSGQPIVAIWSSPLERAIATAEPLASRLGVPIRIEDQLTEWRLADGWAGVVWEDLPSARPGELEAYLERPWDLPFSTESLEELAERMTAVLKGLDRRHPEGDVVVISHQDPVQAGRLAITGGSLRGQQVDKPKHCSVITLVPGSPWTELTEWAPDQGDAFPPPDVDGSV